MTDTFDCLRTTLADRYTIEEASGVGRLTTAQAAARQPADPDGSPSTARSITVQQDPITDTLDPTSGDHWDWYAVRADRAGLLTVATRAGEGDLVLEAFTDGNFSESAERSDQDLQDMTGNEALTLSVSPGQTLYFKVSMYETPDSPISYRLSIGFIPD